MALGDHVLCLPDEQAALTTANRWLDGLPPAGRTIEMAADTSGFAIGGLRGQCSENDGTIKALAYFCARLRDSQQRRHPLLQEFFGLLDAKREMRLSTLAGSQL